jgi:uncharacterized protein YciI
MKSFIIEVTYTAPLDQIDANVTEHRAFLQTGYDKGWLLCSGPQNPRTGGMIVARAPSLDELKNFCNQDPFIQRKLASYRFVEFNPVKRQAFMEDWLNGK